jgi:hypothetical protein
MAYCDLRPSSNTSSRDARPYGQKGDAPHSGCETLRKILANSRPAEMHRGRARRFGQILTMN